MAFLSSLIIAIVKLLVMVLAMVLGVFAGKRLRSLKNKKSNKISEEN